MMRLNRTVPAPGLRTHEGAVATPTNPRNALRRAVLSCMLWEDTFYESGVSIADRIVELVNGAGVTADDVAFIAMEARNNYNLRGVPLLLLAALAKSRKARGTSVLSDAIPAVIARADEPGELLAVYWKINGGRVPIAAAIKRGLAVAMFEFDAYQIAKYDRMGDAIRPLDILRLVHPEPRTEQKTAFGMLAKNRRKKAIASVGTWEHQLSETGLVENSVNTKRELWEAQLTHGKLGYMALLKNLRNMAAANVDSALIINAILARAGAQRVMPFRYISAVRAAPAFAPYLDRALQAAVAELPRLPGKTAILVDVSGSMDAKLSAKGDMTRMDAAAALAVIFPSDHVRVFTFSNYMVEVPAYRGLAGIDAILKSQGHHGTALFEAVASADKLGADRLVVITDEQAHRSAIPVQLHGNGRRYMINVAPEKNGVSYAAGWVHVDGFSEATIRYIAALETVGLD